MRKSDEKENGDPKRTKLPANLVTRAKEMRNVRISFSKDDLEDKGKRLANAELNKKSLEDEFKSMKSDHKAKIDSQDAIINLMSNHISSGYEMQNVECEVVKDYEKGVKTYIHNGTVVDTSPLTAFDRQTELNLINRSPAASEQDAEALDAEAAEEKESETETEEEETNTSEKDPTVFPEEIPGVKSK